MPIFEFKCRECGKGFEKIVFKPLNEVEIECPGCSSRHVEKLISAPGSVGTSGGQGASHSCSGGCCAPSSSKFT